MGDDPLCPRCGQGRLSVAQEGRPDYLRARDACGMEFDAGALAEWERDDA